MMIFIIVIAIAIIILLLALVGYYKEVAKIEKNYATNMKKVADDALNRLEEAVCRNLKILEQNKRFVNFCKELLAKQEKQKENMIEMDSNYHGEEN